MGLTYLDSSMIEQPIESLTAVSFQSTDLIVQSLTASSINSKYNVAQTVSADKTFSNEDSSKAFHFNTGPGSLRATFPNSLENGFNITILNVDNSINQLGSNQLQLSATSLINTINGSQTNSITNTGMLVYKYDGKLYGVGTFD
jgi:hypothetical protein